MPFPSEQLQPLFSVVVATFNAGDRLRTTAECILRQPADLELLIIDATSSDGSVADAAALVVANRDRVRLIVERDGGIYDAMNKGILLSRGRFLLFVGAGDLLIPGVLGVVARMLPAGEDTLVYGDAILEGRRYDGPFDRSKLTNRNVCHQAAFYGRKLFFRHGMYDLRYRYLADYAFNLRCFGDRRKKSPQYIDVVVAVYEGGGVSVMQDDTAFIADFERLLRRSFGTVWYVRNRRAQLRASLVSGIRRYFGGLLRRGLGRAPSSP